LGVRQITRVSVILALSLLVVGSVVASAAGFMGRGQVGSGGLGTVLSGRVDGLDLTVEQQQEILKIRREHSPQILDLQLELQQKMLELQQLWNAEELDEEAIAQKAGEVAALRVRLRKAQEALAEKTRQVLTPEQLEKPEEPTGRPIRRFLVREHLPQRMKRDRVLERPGTIRREVERGIRIPDMSDLQDLVDRIRDRLGINSDDQIGGRFPLWFGHRL